MSASDFERNWRRQQELKGRPLADAIYRDVLGHGTDIDISRADHEEAVALDIHFAIDVTIRLSSGMILNGQEKFLSWGYAKFRTVTVEYQQDPKSGEPGDWFRLGANVYFVGYLNEECTAFEPWVLLDWVRVVVETQAGHIKWDTNGNKDGRARASFRYCRMDMLPRVCVIAASSSVMGAIRERTKQQGQAATLARATTSVAECNR